MEAVCLFAVMLGITEAIRAEMESVCGKVGRL